MRYLVLTDIHANLEALEAVIADVPEYDAVLCLGDLVGYGPNPNECVHRVQELPNLTCLVGNHDWAALGKIDLSTFNPYARQGAEWTCVHLQDDVWDYLEALPAQKEVSEWAIAHASPRDPIWEYMESEEQGPPNFEMFEAPVCFVGHTHVPRIHAEVSNGNGSHTRVSLPNADAVIDLGDGTKRIVNPGGVGQPRNGDPRAAYGVWDTDTNKFTFRRVAYAIPETQKKIRAVGLPIALAQRLAFGI